MKKVAGSFLISLLAFSACKKDLVEEVKVDPLTENIQASIQLMDTIRPKLLGTWSMKEVDVKVFPPFTSDAGIKNDTTLKDFAVLNISSVDNSSQYFYKINNDVKGVLKFKDKTYPVGFTMMPTVTRISNKTGPQVSTLFEYRFSDGSHIVEKEEAYLWDLGFIGENYSIEISSDGKTMVWRGLSRAIKSIYLVKR